MEEILASIRQIISEDGEGASAAKEEGARAEAPAPEPGQTEPEAPYETVVSRFDLEPAPAKLPAKAHPCGALRAGRA